MALHRRPNYSIEANEMCSHLYAKERPALRRTVSKVNIRQECVQVVFRYAHTRTEQVKVRWKSVAQIIHTYIHRGMLSARLSAQRTRTRSPANTRRQHCAWRAGFIYGTHNDPHATSICRVIENHVQMQRNAGQVFTIQTWRNST